MTNPNDSEDKIPSYHECKFEEQKQFTEGLDPDKIGSYVRTSYAPTEPLPPQEVEAKGWTWEDNGVHIDVCCNKRYMFTINDEKAARTVCEKLNELDRLKSYQGKVPSDEDFYKLFEQHKKSEAEKDGADFYTLPDHLQREYEERAAKSLYDSVRSEVAPYIQKLQSELKAAKEALSAVDDILTPIEDYLSGDFRDNVIQARSIIKPILTPKKDNDGR